MAETVWVFDKKISKFQSDCQQYAHDLDMARKAIFRRHSRDDAFIARGASYLVMQKINPDHAP